jgi:beta-lactamase class C
MRLKVSACFIAILVLGFAVVLVVQAAGEERPSVKRIVDEGIGPLMQQYGVPGMAVGIVTKRGVQVLMYGVASRETQSPVTGETLFEIGSVSKTFTVTLAAYAQETGALSWYDPVSHYLPALLGSAFGKASLLTLATHTAGGFPLQVPGDIGNTAQLFEYLQKWQPTYAARSTRVYSNVSIGMLGVATAKSLGGEFVPLMQDKVFSALGLTHTYLEIPEAEARHYAQGYTTQDRPIRMAPGVLALETYGARTTAADLARFVQANLGQLNLDDTLRRAIADTHIGYFQVGPMVQDPIWEQVPYPVDLATLLVANATNNKPHEAVVIDPPYPPQQDVLINKTGSTNGFAAYVVFVPQPGLGIVLLANKNVPISARVTAAYRILTGLERKGAVGE